MTSWTDEREKQLRALYADGLSSSKIAAALGGVTRNGVIGKVHRLGLARPNYPSNTPRDTPIRPKRGRLNGPERKDTLFRLPPLPPAPVEPTARAKALDAINATIPLEQRRSLVELTLSTCKWPIGEVGDPNFFFCGGSAVEGSPYCQAHCNFAYIHPASDRRQAPAYPHIDWKGKY